MNLTRRSLFQLLGAAVAAVATAGAAKSQLKSSNPGALVAAQPTALADLEFIDHMGRTFRILGAQVVGSPKEVQGCTLTLRNTQKSGLGHWLTDDEPLKLL